MYGEIEPPVKVRQFLIINHLFTKDLFSVQNLSQLAPKIKLIVSKIKLSSILRSILL